MAENKTIGGGSLLIAWQLKSKKVLIVGGGEVGAQRIDSLLTTDAHIDLVSPAAGLHPRSKGFLEKYPSRITHIDHEFTFPTGIPSIDVGTYDMVLTALDDTALSRRIVGACRAIRVPVNAADIPDLCDFYFGGQVRDGPLQIMISTNGNGPRIAALIKDRVKGALTGKEGDALTQVGLLRAKLKERAPGVGGDVGRRRMRWMSRLCEQWSLEDLALLDEEAMDRLLDEGWEQNAVPLPVEIVGLRKFGGVLEALRTSWVRSLPSFASFLAGVGFARVVFHLYRARR
jgi:precorrin-2 dehydrogenase/sirohydrochlorin ferrochelatase